MSFNLLCWNIQKLTETKAANFNYNIGVAIKQAAIGENYIGFFLENKVSPERVIAYLKYEMPEFNFDYVSAGGGQYTQENIIYFWKGVSIAKPELVELDISTLSQLNTQRNQYEVNDHAQRTQHLRTRAGSAEFSPTNQYYKSLEWYRKPLLVQVSDGARNYNVATLHAPGPDYMTQEIWNLVYSPALIKANADIVIGDFNLRGEISSASGWIDVSNAKLEHGTTLNNSSTDFGASKWDKVILREDASINAGHLSDLKTIVPEVRAISDHVGLALMVGHQAGGPSIQVAEKAMAIFSGLVEKIKFGFS